MKPDRSGLVSGLAGTAVLLALMSLVLFVKPQAGPSEQHVRDARKVELTEQIRLALASAAEAERSAVLATTDVESMTFANQARAATSSVEQARVALDELLRAGGTAKEKSSLAAFSKAFSELQRVDQELLDLAVKNTNVKASALAFGPSAEALRGMDVALSHIIAESAYSSVESSRKVMLFAAGAQAAALRIQTLLPPHIAEESDQKMDELEALMATEDRAVHTKLSALAGLVPRGNADLEAATSSYARFTELRAQVLRLSRENTNVRSLPIALKQKRKVTMLCQDALATLDKAIEEAYLAGQRTPIRPR